MLLKTLMKQKNSLTTLSEDTTLETALSVLEDSDFRCVPILDKTGTFFRGNIYKMHIYRHKSRGGDMQLPVTTLLKNSTKFISINAAFFTVFFAIKDLPYIAVLDENSQFSGILTHTKLLSMLADGWNIHTGSYVISVLSTDDRGSLVKMTKAIAKYTPINNCLTLGLTASSEFRQILFTLPAEVNKRMLDKIIHNLHKKGFEVTEIEDLHTKF
ncbi:hypothetical protein FC70_GL000035 [Paucilactobacillus oligofermentans DSM 15707 = LMG 22743]|uniref:CBS domain-containing protein n=1 Tax=Paucilactobacillus oligofermentans DSM 15707 = LMG 22743 TaxID=1423778 RepID=A0A0R1RXI4_9LACO|nr:cyclic di-AMP binding protein CbpA [Paucilactobacillus oligofermentans]KRL58147.1 hypothetical protein FC70_GL000035 [Paucilactobacillus oligofermentans DSM 15707 = LMG 22743]CUS26848.1 Cystathionine beta-synthase domain-containing protein [Paucilactobacillus oligofermentans DSM 15707 = LMG 22743]